ncbi:MAG: cytochrome c biogenesis protein ResB [Micrococcales bacterium]|nr:cytochrome c biogenesis protein ResB [Micrococcales bacterium]
MDSELDQAPSPNGEEAPSELESGQEPELDQVAPVEFFSKVYQFFYSKTLGLVLMLALAAFILIGTLIEQAPPGVLDDSQAKTEFLDQMSNRYGAFAGLFGGVGFFHIYSSVGFLILVGLLGASLLACSVHRAPVFWRQVRHPLTHATDRLFAGARHRTQISLPKNNDTLDQVKAVLHSKKLRVKDDPVNKQALFADKFAWGGFGTVVAHIAFLMIIAAFITTSATAISQPLVIPVGESRIEVGHGSGLDAQATQFEMAETELPDGARRPTDYMSKLIVRRGEVVLGQAEVRVNQPLRAGGFKFHQTGYGLGPLVKVTGPAGEVLFDGFVDQPGVSQDGSTAAGFIDLAGTDLYVMVNTPTPGGAEAAGIEDGSAVLSLWRSGLDEPLLMEKVNPGEGIDAGDYSATFVGERQYTVITARRDPGALVMWIGCVLLLVGMMTTFTARHRRYWIRVTESPDEGRVLQVASTDKDEVSIGRHFGDLVADLRDGIEQVKGKGS